MHHKTVLSKANDYEKSKLLIIKSSVQLRSNHQASQSIWYRSNEVIQTAIMKGLCYVKNLYLQGVIFSQELKILYAFCRNTFCLKFALIQKGANINLCFDAKTI